jgi:hypothetical protein
MQLTEAVARVQFGIVVFKAHSGGK